MNLKAIIVEDEAVARRRVKFLLANDPQIEVIAECASGKEAVKAIVESKPDLVFLDVQIPELNGFEVIKAIPKNLMPAIIFTTAYDNYALQAFEASAVDYLLKPFEPERFEQALARAKKQISSNQNDKFQKRFETLLQNMGSPTKFLERLVIKSGEEIVLLKVKDIDWIQPKGDYLHLQAGKRVHILRQTMMAIETKLDPKQFVRIHRSTIVNVERIKKLYRLFHNEYEIELEDGTRLTSSRGYRHKLQEILGKEL